MKNIQPGFILFFLVVLTGFTGPPIAAQHILIAYYSQDGHTEKLARAVADGARLSGSAVVKLKTVQETMNEDILWADAVIVGSPVHVANVAAPVQAFISQWPYENQAMQDKVGAAFVTGGGISAGEELVQMNIIQSMLIRQMIIVGGPDWTQAFGASAVTGEGPWKDENEEEATVDGMFLEKGRSLGRRVAEVAARLVER